MFQTHCYDAWLSPSARKTDFFMYSQLGGTLPAPLFLFLAGISFALVTDRLRQKGMQPSKIARTTILRGAEILGMGLLFRLQEYVIAWGWAPWSDLLRVDVLNTIGLSMMLMGILCWLISSRDQGSDSRARFGIGGILTALGISLLTPPLWTTGRPDWLPWPIESYVNGVHNLGEPQAWLFPIFPWAGFAFAGLAVGFLLLSDRGKQRGAVPFGLLAGAGIVLIYLAKWMDRSPIQLYGVYDFWHTSPEFFLMRVGILFLVLATGYAWCRWGAGQWGFSPLIQMGQTSLLVYWVHLEFVYGRVSILPKRVQSIPMASAGLCVIFLAILGLSLARTRFKGRVAEFWNWTRNPSAMRSS
jgi:uncharacterized membrane protein